LNTRDSVACVALCGFGAAGAAAVAGAGIAAGAGAAGTGSVVLRLGGSRLHEASRTALANAIAVRLA
jgi:hypothetical protein